MNAKETDAPSVVACSYCRRAFAADDEQVVHYQAREVVGVYHDWCRPDRRRSGCTGSACRAPA